MESSCVHRGQEIELAAEVTSEALNMVVLYHSEHMRIAAGCPSHAV